MAGIKHKNCLLTIFPLRSLCMKKEKREVEKRKGDNTNTLGKLIEWSKLT